MADGVCFQLHSPHDLGDQISKPMIKSLPTTAYSHEAPFIRSALAQGLRLDGRRPQEPRDVDVALSRGEVTATATVTLGKTVVVAVVSAELVAPYPDRPTEGLLQFVADVSPLAEAHGVTSAELTRLLDRSVRESDAIDTGAMPSAAPQTHTHWHTRD